MTTFKTGDLVQRRGEQGPNCPIGTVKRVHRFGQHALVGVSVSFSGLAPMWHASEDLVPAIADCEHCGLSIGPGGKGRDVGTWVHVDGGFSLCGSGETSATPRQ